MDRGYYKIMDILQEIIAIDKAAAARVEALKEQTAKELDESGENAAKEREKLLSSERKKLEQQTRELEQRLSDKRAETMSKREKETRRLDETFARYKDEWKNEIMKRIVGV